jgi:tetratricopeptide (TPR) repeat protein
MKVQKPLGEKIVSSKKIMVVKKFALILMWLFPGINTGFSQSEDPALRLKLLLLDDRFEELLQVTDSLELADSLMDQVYYFRGRAYQSMLNYDSAYHYYHMAYQVDSSNLSFRISMGSMMYRLGRIREGIDIYEAIVAEFQPRDQHLAELANLYSIRKEYAKSLAIYKGLLEKDSLNYFYAKRAGKNFLDMNQLDSAIHYYEYAFDLNQRDVFLAHRLGNLHFRNQDLPTAIMRVSTGMLYDSNNLDLLKLRGYLFLHFGRNDLAIVDMKKAWLQDSLSVFTNKYLGMSYHEEKQFDQARIALLQAFTLDSTDAETAFFLGSACRRSKYEEDAVGYFKKAIELRLPDPEKLKDIYSQLAELFKVLHRFDEAFEAYDMALEYDPADNTIYFKIAQVYDRNLNRKKTAIEYYEKFLSGGSTDQQLFNAEKGKFTALERHARERINILKEDLFFEK